MMALFFLYLNYEYLDQRQENVQMFRLTVFERAFPSNLNVNLFV